ncbi:hypothetical protein Y1Q_0023704 [Alligator mississippiensis]|uniref:Uncharacterized protein n=1 Tax=Alligator mississippiensis TaxID=8496 RepID=A0A151NBU8_ALLMI|nr:hypothetical protein Y1Q_0023704 [Alligator mississippiensis]
MRVQTLLGVNRHQPRKDEQTRRQASRSELTRREENQASLTGGKVLRRPWQRSRWGGSREEASACLVFKPPEEAGKMADEQLRKGETPAYPAGGKGP